ncbi:hypothetical protein K501DRAFT_273040 [Backusella circina FSU 941]|nr:hypothetical protein K501DRAFT_273040 [Backusella circina FSU 941]
MVETRTTRGIVVAWMTTTVANAKPTVAVLPCVARVDAKPTSLEATEGELVETTTETTVPVTTIVSEPTTSKAIVRTVGETGPLVRIRVLPIVATTGTGGSRSETKARAFRMEQEKLGLVTASTERETTTTEGQVVVSTVQAPLVETTKGPMATWATRTVLPTVLAVLLPATLAGTTTKVGIGVLVGATPTTDTTATGPAAGMVGSAIALLGSREQQPTTGREGATTLRSTIVPTTTRGVEGVGNSFQVPEVVATTIGLVTVKGADTSTRKLLVPFVGKPTQEGETGIGARGTMGARRDMETKPTVTIELPVTSSILVTSVPTTVVEVEMGRETTTIARIPGPTALLAAQTVPCALATGPVRPRTPNVDGPALVVETGVAVVLRGSTTGTPVTLTRATPIP